MMDKVWKRRERKEEKRKEEKGREEKRRERNRREEKRRKEKRKEEKRREEKRWLSAYLIFHAKQTLGIVSEFNFYGSDDFKSSRLIPVLM